MVDHARIAAKIMKAATAPAWIRGGEEWAAVRAIVGEWLQAHVMKNGESLMGALKANDDSADVALPHPALVVLLKMADNVPMRLEDVPNLVVLQRRGLIMEPSEPASKEFTLTDDGLAMVATLRQQALDNPAGNPGYPVTMPALGPRSIAAGAKALSPAMMDAIEELHLEKGAKIARPVALALARRALVTIGDDMGLHLTEVGRQFALAVLELRRP